MIVVFDTSVIVASLRSRHGASFQLLQMIREGENKFTLVLSVPLFLEDEAVLKRPEQLVISHLTTQDIDNILAMLAKRGLAIRIPFLWRHQLNDCKDEMVLETAINGQAKAIITFNRKDFLVATLQFGINVLSPSQFYTQLRK